MKNYEEKLKTNTKKILRTAMMNRYLFKFAFRLITFFVVLNAYVFHKNTLIFLMTYRINHFLPFSKITPLHVLWLIFMLMMIRHLHPMENFTMALRKGEKKAYRRHKGYLELELLQFVQKQNQRAWLVMLIWLCLNAVWGLLYLLHMLNEVDLLMITVFYFLCDYICILIFCPYQTFIMRNRCCVNCRIYDWGHFMMFTPMLFIRNFFSWSLFFTSLVVLIRWEIIYAKHPERFWSGSNEALQCANCKDKTCQVKKKVTAAIVPAKYRRPPEN